jgi:hypothetical protein
VRVWSKTDFRAVSKMLANYMNLLSGNGEKNTDNNRSSP